MAVVEEGVPSLVEGPEVNILEELKASRPLHPALGRLHDRIVGMVPTSEITSYDRMHHRHSRK
jgi:hypothetical protein